MNHLFTCSSIYFFLYLFNHIIYCIYHFLSQIFVLFFYYDPPHVSTSIHPKMGWIWISLLYRKFTNHKYGCSVLYTAYPCNFDEDLPVPDINNEILKEDIFSLYICDGSCMCKHRIYIHMILHNPSKTVSLDNYMRTTWKDKC